MAIVTIDVTVTGSDGTTSSGSVAIDVSQPQAEALAPADSNEAMLQRSQALRWGGSRA